MMMTNEVKMMMDEKVEQKGGEENRPQQGNFGQCLPVPLTSMAY